MYPFYNGLTQLCYDVGRMRFAAGIRPEYQKVQFCSSASGQSSREEGNVIAELKQIGTN